MTPVDILKAALVGKTFVQVENGPVQNSKIVDVEMVFEISPEAAKFADECVAKPFAKIEVPENDNELYPSDNLGGDSPETDETVAPVEDIVFDPMIPNRTAGIVLTLENGNTIYVADVDEMILE